MFVSKDNRNTYSSLYRWPRLHPKRCFFQTCPLHPFLFPLLPLRSSRGEVRFFPTTAPRHFFTIWPRNLLRLRRLLRVRSPTRTLRLPLNLLQARTAWSFLTKLEISHQ